VNCAPIVTAYHDVHEELSAAAGYRVFSNDWSFYVVSYSDAPPRSHCWLYLVAVNVKLTEIFLATFSSHCDIVKCAEDSNLPQEPVIAETFTPFIYWVSTMKALLA
jgi:hypothetical protein